MHNKVKVLYIAGQHRSGSTILGNTLGQIEGFTHVGELISLWNILVSGRFPCGCGVPVVACKTWESVLKEACGIVDKSLVSQMLQYCNVEFRDRTFLRAATPKGTRSLQRRLAKPLAELDNLYRAIQRVFKSDIIVDSSKHPMYGYILQLTEAIDPYVLHLTRDPRASTYSFLCKRFKDGYFIEEKENTPLNASLVWNYKNGVIEFLSKRFQHRPLHLRYEDFVANPRGSLQRILNFVDESRSSLPLQDEHSLYLETQHTVSGNPSRFVTGKVELRENDAWKAKMKKRDRMVVTALTWPLLLKYGYPTSPRGS